MRAAAGGRQGGKLSVMAAAAAAALVLLRGRHHPGPEAAARPADGPARADGATGRSGARGDGHGRAATTPSEIPKRGWRDILLRVKDEVTTDNLSIVAAGVAFYALLAIVPAMGALVSIYGLVADPTDVERHIRAIGGFLPQEAAEIIYEQLHRVATSANTSLSFGAIFGLLLTLWSATKGVSTMFNALNVAYDEEEERGFLRFNLIALGFTLGAILLVLVILALVVGVPAVIQTLGIGGPIAWVVSIARWPLLALLLIVAIGLLYRYGPSRDEPKWRWVTWGAVFATVVWLLGSMGFSFYVSNFGSYNETYGSLGAVVILMMWFWLSAYIILIGAEINAEMEHQTAQDTTEGHPKPLGTRRAYVADTVGETR